MAARTSPAVAVSPPRSAGRTAKAKIAAAAATDAAASRRRGLTRRRRAGTVVTAAAAALEPSLELVVEARPQRRCIHVRPEERGELRVALVVVERGHRCTSSLSVSGRSARRMAARASERREATVPTGTSSASATVP